MRKIKDPKIQRMDFIGIRVISSQLLLIFLTNALMTIVFFLKIAELIVSFWYIYLVIIPLLTVIITYKKRKILYYNHHWSILLVPIAIIWLLISTYIAIIVDFYLGFGKTYTVSIVLSVLYLMGYLFARILRIKKICFLFKKVVKTRRRKSKIRINLFFLVLIFSIILILFTFILGWNILYLSLKSNNIKSIYREDYGAFRNCPMCAIGAFTMISGIGLVISMLLHYYMFYLLYTPKEWSVWEDSPNYLIMKCLTATIIIFGILWGFAEFLIPPIFGGGGGGGGGGGSGGSGGGGGGSSSFKAKYRKKLNIVEKEWKRYNL